VGHPGPQAAGVLHAQGLVDRLLGDLHVFLRIAQRQFALDLLPGPVLPQSLEQVSLQRRMTASVQAPRLRPGHDAAGPSPRVRHVRLRTHPDEPSPEPPRTALHGGLEAAERNRRQQHVCRPGGREVRRRHHDCRRGPRPRPPPRSNASGPPDRPRTAISAASLAPVAEEDSNARGGHGTHGGSTTIPGQSPEGACNDTNFDLAASSLQYASGLSYREVCCFRNSRQRAAGGPRASRTSGNVSEISKHR
jgi:hypothetical protein